eukprot:9346721-Ditylum_brightwellii.AAC.2
MTAAAITRIITVKLAKRKKQHHQPFHLPCYATISSKKLKNEVTHKELPATFPLPPTVLMIV